MKVKNALTVVLFLISFVHLVSAQKKTKQDTIYYLLDTLRMPAKDRMFTINTDGVQRFYKIHCPCLNKGIEPEFRCNITKQTIINKQVLKQLNFISLADLIELVRKNDNEQFNDRHLIYFIEPEKKNYTKRKAFFLGGKVITVE